MTKFTYLVEEFKCEREYSCALCTLCGKSGFRVKSSHIKRGEQLSCGCIRAYKIGDIDYTGQEINDSTVIGRVEGYPLKWRVLFSCGHTSDLPTYSLKNLKANCGKCNVTKACVKRNTSHGMSKSLAYQSWLNMMRRCYEEKNNRYDYYGERGITVCDRWRDSFENFYEDMGERLPNMSLERVELDEGYSPDNCVWANDITQANNKSNNIHIINDKGEQWSLRRWCEILGKDYKQCHYRIRKKGESVDEVLGYGYRLKD